MDPVAIGLICGAVAALPGVILLERVIAGKTSADLGKAFAVLFFSFVLLMGALAAVSVQEREYVLSFGVSAVGVFLALWIVGAIRASRATY